MQVTSPAALTCVQDIPLIFAKLNIAICPFCEVDLIVPVHPVVETGITDPAFGDGLTKTGIANTFIVKHRTSLVTPAKSVAVKQYSGIFFQYSTFLPKFSFFFKFSVF